ncbi:MAG: hypothetical protein ACMXYE_01275 [Candidatus Woesearchaeota archaeon]
MVTKKTQKQPNQSSSATETELKEELDYWVKDFEKKIQRTSEQDLRVDENTQNIEYNYELIKELQKDVTQIKKDIAEIRSSLVMALRSRPLKEL